MHYQGRAVPALLAGWFFCGFWPATTFAEPLREPAPAATVQSEADPETTFAKSDELERAADEHLEQGRVAEAIRDLTASRVLRASLLGDEHWVVRTATCKVQALERIEKFPTLKRAAALRSIREWKTIASGPESREQPVSATDWGPCCERLCRIVGDESLISLEARVQLAEMQAGSGLFAEARVSAGTAFKQVERLLGTSHPWYAFSLSLMATADGQLGKWDEAKREAALALRANEHLWGEDTPPCGMNYLTLTWVDINRKDFTAARRHADNALHALAEAREEDPANYALAQAHLAHALFELGETTQARNEYVSLVTFFDRKQGVPGELQKDICQRYARLLTQLGLVQDLEAIEKRLAELEPKETPIVR